MRLIAVILVALIASASASAAQIQVGARLSHQHRIALSPAGRSGDVDSSYWRVRDRYGRPVGDMLLDCRWITDAGRLCVGQLTMPLGTISLMGASATRIVGQFSVVGGTGRYLSANGSLTFNAIGTRRYVLSVVYRQ